MTGKKNSFIEDLWAGLWFTVFTLLPIAIVVWLIRFILGTFGVM